MASAEKSSFQEPNLWENFNMCLPHPYLTRYIAEPQQGSSDISTYRLVPASESSKKGAEKQPSFSLHNGALSFSSLVKGRDIPLSDNTQWARIQRSPSVTIAWNSIESPTIAQIWLLIYSYFTVYYNEENIRLSLVGSQTNILREELVAVGLAKLHPLPFRTDDLADKQHNFQTENVVLIRSSFWQGAGSPFGARSAWLPSDSTARQPLHSFPLLPTTQTINNKFSDARINTIHPIRSRKPTPGSTFYSRYIPHLDEHFSMVALNHENAEHLDLFHNWQNDPRVAAGWNLTGGLVYHKKYLKDLHNDPHVLNMLALFNETPFAYFEVYWAKEDDLGTHYIAGDYDRGRRSLVGNPTFRGPHRAHAWWSSLMHYLFLDEPRTTYLVGEPKHTNERVLELDALHGFHVEKFVDLPNKRSALMKCSRERYFGLCTVGRPWEVMVKEKEERERLKARL